MKEALSESSCAFPPLLLRRIEEHMRKGASNMNSKTVQVSIERTSNESAWRRSGGEELTEEPAITENRKQLYYHTALERINDCTDDYDNC